MCCQVFFCVCVFNFYLFLRSKGIEWGQENMSWNKKKEDDENETSKNWRLNATTIYEYVKVLRCSNSWKQLIYPARWVAYFPGIKTCLIIKLLQ